jgi:CheY-like chemotaxis protein
MARLLIVEDHPELASLMVATAQSRGHEAQAALTGEQALALIRPDAFEAAVVDLLLPDMRGSTVLAALRESSIPAIAISGVFKGDRFAREATEIHGARAFVEKPFELTHLLETLEQLCGLPRLPPPPPEDDDVEVVDLEELAPMEEESAASDDEGEAEVTELTDEVIQPIELNEDEPLLVPAESLDSTPDEPLGATPPPAPPELEEEPPTMVAATPPAPAPVPPPPPELKEEPITANAPLEVAPTPTAVTPAEPAPPEPPPEEAPPAPVAKSEPPPPEAPASEPAPVPPPTSAPEEDEVVISLALAEEQPAEAPGGKSEPPASVASTDPDAGLALPFAERQKVWAKPDEAGRRRLVPEWSLSGNLKDTSIPRLLNAYYESRHSGELKLKHGNALKVIYFEAGRIIYAASNITQERFGRLCVRRGVVTEEQLKEVLAFAKEHTLRTGEALVRQGLLTAERRRELIEEQVKELVWATFSWTDGAYGFSRMRPPQGGLVKLSVFPGNLILEGVLKLETLPSLRQRMPRSRRLFPKADPPYGLHELNLAGPQALLLAYADGSKTVEDLLALTDLSERDVLATLRALELLGVLEERNEEPKPRQRISFGL